MSWAPWMTCTSASRPLAPMGPGPLALASLVNASPTACRVPSLFVAPGASHASQRHRKNDASPDHHTPRSGCHDDGWKPSGCARRPSVARHVARTSAVHTSLKPTLHPVRAGGEQARYHGAPAELLGPHEPGRTQVARPPRVPCMTLARPRRGLARPPTPTGHRQAHGAGSHRARVQDPRTVQRAHGSGGDAGAVGAHAPWWTRLSQLALVVPAHSRTGHAQ